MDRKTIISKTINKIQLLSDSKLEKVSKLLDEIINSLEEERLNRDIEKIVSNSESFDFLNFEEDIYSDEDLLKKFV